MTNTEFVYYTIIMINYNLFKITIMQSDIIPDRTDYYFNKDIICV